MANTHVPKLNNVLATIIINVCIYTIHIGQKLSTASSDSKNTLASIMLLRSRVIEQVQLPQHQV